MTKGPIMQFQRAYEPSNENEPTIKDMFKLFFNTFLVLVVLVFTINVISEIADNVQFINGMNSELFIERMFKILIGTCVVMGVFTFGSLGVLYAIVFIIENNYIPRAIEYIKNCNKHIIIKKVKQFFMGFIITVTVISMPIWMICNFIVIASESTIKINYNAIYDGTFNFWTRIGCMIGIAAFGYAITFMIGNWHDKNFYIKQNIQLRNSFKQLNKEFNEMIH